MRRTSVTVLGVSALVAAAALPAAGAVPEQAPGQPAVLGSVPAKGGGTDKAAAPAGPNPYLALLPDPEAVDHAAWSAHLSAESQAQAARLQRSTASPQGRPDPGRLTYREREPVGAEGRNDTNRTAERVTGFGTGRRQSPAAQVLGWLGSPGEPVAIAANVEDDGSIPLARDTGVGETVEGVTTSGVVGDGPHGSTGTGTGDLDVYEVHGITGQQLVVDVDTPDGELDSIVLLYSETGELVAFNDDGSFDDLDSLLTYTVPADGSYYAFVTGYFTFPADPFDSGSGDGAMSEGPYEVTVSQAEPDTDVFAVDLSKGDVLGLSVSGAATRLDVFEPDGTQVQGSAQDLTALYPMGSPLPGGGNAVLDHVSDVRGRHYIAVRGSGGDYELTAEVYRPGIEGQRREQTLFLDFDGARVNTALFGGPGVRDLSPLRSFLPQWGLRDSDYKPLVRQIVATVTENLERDLRRTGSEIRILNSVEHRDPFGQDNVSRVIVGGTIAESGIPTIGIAQSIDPGNFTQEETALVLLDALSGSPEEWGDVTLNYYLTPRSDRLRFIGQAVGNVTSHEAGHFLGSWHVDQFNDVLNLMDQGGNFPLLYGVGPDGVGGTRDDWDVDFGEDTFVPDEGFSGLENTLSRTELALTVRPIPPR